MALFSRSCKGCVLSIFICACMSMSAYASPLSAASELREEVVCAFDETASELDKGASISAEGKQAPPGYSEGCYVRAASDDGLIRWTKKISDAFEFDAATNDTAATSKTAPNQVKDGLGTIFLNALSSTANSADKVVTKASDLVLNALSLIGVNYRYGGNHPSSGLDCSGFVRYVVRDTLGFLLPRRAVEMSRMGEVVSKESLQPGDLVFFNTMRSAFSHVGIYIGDNKFVHAPSQGKQIRIDNIRASYWSRRYNGARRVNTEVISDSDKHLARLRKQFIDRTKN